MIKLIYLFALKKTMCSLDPVLCGAGCSAHQHPGVTGASCHLPAVVSEAVPVHSWDTAGLKAVFAACRGFEQHPGLMRVWAAPWAVAHHLVQGMELLPERWCSSVSVQGWGCSQSLSAKNRLCQPPQSATASTARAARCVLCLGPEPGGRC